MSWAGECKKILNQIRKSPNAEPFLFPVDWKALGLKDYPSVIKSPMDLSTVASKLGHGVYTSVADFAADFDLIVSNCKVYNAEGSPVFEMAVALEGEFQRLLKSMRRWQDDAKKILSLLKKNPNGAIFLEPVDWKALGLKDYLQVVKRPMDLGTVGAKLAADEYASIDQFFDDVYLIFANCMAYNADGSQVYEMALAMKNETDRLRAGEPTPKVSAAVLPSAPPTEKRGPGAPKRKSMPAESEEQAPEVDETDDPDRREDIARLGRRFAALHNDYLGGAIRFIHAKCPHAVRPMDGGQIEVDLDAIAKDTSSSHSVNQLVKVMLYLQQNPE